MTSNDIYTPFIPDQYCVYHTTYSGTLLPQNYIGSSSVDNVIVKKYHGSVKSARYKDIWLSELQLHPELFSTSIVSLHDTRSNATHKELQVQKLFNVVKSDLFINRSYASINGFGDTTFTPEEKEATSKKMSVTRKGVPKGIFLIGMCTAVLTSIENWPNSPPAILSSTAKGPLLSTATISSAHQISKSLPIKFSPNSPSPLRVEFSPVAWTRLPCIHRRSSLELLEILKTVAH